MIQKPNYYSPGHSGSDSFYLNTIVIFYHISKLCHKLSTSVHNNLIRPGISSYPCLFYYISYDICPFVFISFISNQPVAGSIIVVAHNWTFVLFFCENWYGPYIMFPKEHNPLLSQEACHISFYSFLLIDKCNIYYILHVQVYVNCSMQNVVILYVHSWFCLDCIITILPFVSVEMLVQKIYYLCKLYGVFFPPQKNIVLCTYEVQDLLFLIRRYLFADGSLVFCS